MPELINVNDTTALKNSLPTPNGIAGILSTFGNIHDYIQADGALDSSWQMEILDYAALAVPLMLSFDHSLKITHFRCHKLLVEPLERVFEEITARGLQSNLTSFGGCFSFRPQRGGAGKLSTHCWGIAIDLNPETNVQGTAGDMNPELISVFKQAGFIWGGNWPDKTKDPMHFQFCTGY